METARCKALLASAELKSFTGAAERLNYTPSGVSQLVTALERELGLKLLYRTRRGVAATPDGERLLPVIRELLAQEEYLYQLAGDSRGLLAGTVKVASYVSIAMHWLPGLIRAFQEKYPQIRIQLREGISPEIEEWLKNREVDVGFTNRPEDGAFEWFPLERVRMMAVLPKSHPLAKEECCPIARCAGEKFIMVVSENRRDPDLINVLARHGIAPDIAYTTFLDSTVVAMVEQGLGITFMNEWIANSYDYDVVRLPLDPPEYLHLGIAAVSTDTLSPAARTWIRFARRYLPELLRGAEEL